MTSSIWVGSIIAGQRSGCSTVSILTLPPMVDSSNSRMLRTVSLRSTGLGSSRWRREKASIWAVSWAPLSAAWPIIRRR